MIYLDNNATTRPTTRVVEAMLPYLRDCYFNASASTAAFTGVERPRRDAAAAMARMLNAEEPKCFTFTSGATESNNWVFASVARAGTRGRVVISNIEHASVSEPAAELARLGFEIIEVPVDNQGVVGLSAFRDALTENTLLVSVMAASNETGVLEPMARLGAIIRERAPIALFHTDATQAVGKIPIDLQGAWEEVDLLSFSAHKFHGPKGIGGLYVRPGLRIEPMLRGGGQEQGLRPGTVNTPGLAGLAAAATDVNLPGISDLQLLRDEFEDDLRKAVSVLVHSSGVPRLPNTSCFSIPGAVGEDVAQTLAARGLVVGTGSACSSGAIHPPKTVLALGIDHRTASGTLRVSLSRFTTGDDLRVLTSALVEAIAGGRTDSIAS